MIARLACLAPALVASLLTAPLALAAPAEYAGASADGSKVFFTTSGKLVPGDTDNGFRDVYERSYDSELGVETYVTREISTGPTGGNDSYDVTYDGVSTSGNRVFFSTKESLVAADADRSTDVYMRDLTTGTTTLVSQGAESCAPGCGNGEADAEFAGATPDGSTVFFVSEESLSGADTDGSPDIYARNFATGKTTLVSQGAASCAPGCGNGSAPAVFRGASADGTRVVFESAERLAPGDGNSRSDVYERNLSAGTTSLVTIEGSCPVLASECAPTYRAMSSDGSRVFFETKERLATGDEDNAQDVYEWDEGSLTLVSTGAEGEKGKGSADATFAGTAANATAVFFETGERLSAADTDTATDVYERSGGVTTLVSTGPEGAGGNVPATLDRVSTDGSKAIFSTAESLVAADADTRIDIYERDLGSGTTTLVSGGDPACIESGCGNGEFDALYADASSSGAQVFFSTAERLSPDDTDSNPDIYEWDSGATSRVSTGPLGGNGNHTPHLFGVSTDGAHAFFTTDERLTEGDNFLGEQDVYDHSASGTLLVSAANSSELQLGPPAPQLTGTSPASPGESAKPGILGSEGDPGAAIKIYATADCFGAPVGTGTTGELEAGGIAVSVKAGSTTTFHATATNSGGDTSECSESSVTYRQATEGGGPEGGGGGPEGGGSGGAGGSAPSSATGNGGGVTSAPGGFAYLTPQVRITFGPAFKTRMSKTVFRFTDATGQPGTRFICRLDRKHWSGCNSPQWLRGLGRGKHVFRVRAVNAIGVWQPAAAVRAFKVVRGGSPVRRSHRGRR